MCDMFTSLVAVVVNNLNITLKHKDSLVGIQCGL